MGERTELPTWLPNVIALASIAVLVGVVSGLVGIYVFFRDYHDNDKWMLMWTAAGPIFSLLTLLVLIATALFARNLIDITGKAASADLTDRVLNSDWMFKANDAFTRVFEARGGNLDAVRAYCNEVYQNRFRDEATTTAYRDFSRMLGAYAYLARLYLRNVLDEQLLIESAALTVTPAMFALQDQMMILINSGAYEEHILEFARVCIKRAQKRPELLLFFSQLRGWSV